MRQKHVRFDRSRSDTDLPLALSASGRGPGASSRTCVARCLTKCSPSMSNRLVTRNRPTDCPDNSATSRFTIALRVHAVASTMQSGASSLSTRPRASVTRGRAPPGWTGRAANGRRHPGSSWSPVGVPRRLWAPIVDFSSFALERRNPTRGADRQHTTLACTARLSVYPSVAFQSSRSSTHCPHRDAGSPGEEVSPSPLPMTRQVT